MSTFRGFCLGVVLGAVLWIAMLAVAYLAVRFG